MSEEPTAVQDSRLEPAAVEEQVLEIVRELLRERGDAIGNVTLNSHFERDLGLASLELVEFMVRCEARFEIVLPDSIAEEAETPARWVKAILEGGHEAEAKGAYRISPPRTDALSEPAAARTLADVLGAHAEADPGRVHIHLLTGETGQGITYGALYDDASAVAAGLAERGLRRNETVAIMLPSSADFFSAFFGVMLAGGIPVPVYPPTRPDRIEDYVRRQIVVLRSAGIRSLIAFDEVRAIVQILRVNLATLVDVSTVAQLRQARGRLGLGSVKPADTAVLQFTSGSTGDPKGVALSHAAVLANIRGIGGAVEIRPGDAVVTWLPLYSDLGLIGCWLLGLYYAAPVTVLSPLDFLRRPERWLRAVHDSRGTLSAAPNFAYELCTRRIPAWTIEGIDLSCWRAAVNAGEPVLRETVDRFTQRFAKFGFNSEALLPCYGLAESTVALTMPPPHRLPVRDRVDRRAFETSRRTTPVAGDGESALCFFSAGQPVEGQQIRIVDEQGNDVPDRTVGRVLFRGASTMSGYYRDSEATAAVTRDGGWIDTGDFGYQTGGEFYFTARSRDAIVKAGRSMSPLDVEAAAGSLAGVVPGSAVAFSAPDADSGAENLIVTAETPATNQEDFRRIEAEIVRVVDNFLGMPPDKIRLVEPGCLPRTPNGKVRRNEIRSLYVSGKLRSGRRPPWLQIVRLQWENLGSLILLGLRRAGSVLLGGATRVAVGMVARWAGLATRLTGNRGIIRLACRRILKLHGHRFSLQGAPPAEDGEPAVLIANRSGTLDPLVIVATLPGKVRFADRAALNGLRRPLAYLLEPLVLGHEHGKTIPAAGAVRSRVSEALENSCIVVAFPEGPVGTEVARSRYRLDPFQAAVEKGAPLRPAAVRERAQQQQPQERALVRRVTLVIVRDPARPSDQPDFFALRERVRRAIGDHHA